MVRLDSPHNTFPDDDDVVYWAPNPFRQVHGTPLLWPVRAR
jgi:hypothetical protein